REAGAIFHHQIAEELQRLDAGRAIEGVFGALLVDVLPTGRDEIVDPGSGAVFAREGVDLGAPDALARLRNLARHAGIVLPGIGHERLAVFVDQPGFAEERNVVIERADERIEWDA